MARLENREALSKLIETILDCRQQSKKQVISLVRRFRLRCLWHRQGV